MFTENSAELINLFGFPIPPAPSLWEGAGEGVNSMKNFVHGLMRSYPAEKHLKIL
jgi:hypothetical protein